MASLRMKEELIKYSLNWYHCFLAACTDNKQCITKWAKIQLNTQNRVFFGYKCRVNYSIVTQIYYLFYACSLISKVAKVQFQRWHATSERNKNDITKHQKSQLIWWKFLNAKEIVKQYHAVHNSGLSCTSELWCDSHVPRNC